MKRLNLLILLSFLCGVNNIISQEWETIYDCNPDISKCYYEDAIEYFEEYSNFDIPQEEKDNALKQFSNSEEILYVEENIKYQVSQCRVV